MAQVQLPGQVVLQAFGLDQTVAGILVVVAVVAAAVAADIVAAVVPAVVGGVPFGVAAVAGVGLGVGATVGKQGFPLRQQGLAFAGDGVGVRGVVAFFPVQQGIAFDRRGDLGLEFQRRQLQQVQGLAQLRRQYQLLSQRCLQPWFHRPRKLYKVGLESRQPSAMAPVFLARTPCRGRKEAPGGRTNGSCPLSRTSAAVTGGTIPPGRRGVRRDWPAARPEPPARARRRR